MGVGAWGGGGGGGWGVGGVVGGIRSELMPACVCVWCCRSCRVQ